MVITKKSPPHHQRNIFLIDITLLPRYITLIDSNGRTSPIALLCRLNNKNITVNEFKLQKYETVSGGTSDLWRITLKLTHNSTFFGNQKKAVFEQQTTISSRLNDIGGTP
jgi:hypothetical protein